MDKLILAVNNNDKIDTKVVIWMNEHEQNRIQDANDEKFLPVYSVRSGIGQEVLPDIYCYTNQIVNVVFVGNREVSDEWVMIDTGMPKSSKRLRTIAEDRFGKNNPPQAIILTHGHFDHVGAVVDLVDEWNVPVYAHEAELPFLTGKQSYPEPDDTVEGGLVAKMSPLFPNEQVNLGHNVEALP